MNDQMDVDMDPSTSNPSVPTTEGPARLYLPPDQLAALNKSMLDNSTEYDWQGRIDAGYISATLIEVVWLLVGELANTDLNTSIIPIPTPVQTDDLLKSFSDVEVEHWKAGVRNNDWESLISHRTYNFASNGLITFKCSYSQTSSWNDVSQ